MADEAAQREVLGRVADEIARRGLSTVALFTLESLRPLSFVASQALVVLGPFVQALLSPRDYDVLCEALEDRANIDWLIRRLEESEADPAPPPPDEAAGGAR